MNLSNQSVLVIGGAGYIGSHVVLALCEKGYNVTVFDNLSTGHEINIDSRAVLIKGDILNNNELKNAFNQNFDAVLHFAALKAVGDSMLQPGEYAKVNITGTINILNQMIEHKVQNIIFSSKCNSLINCLILLSVGDLPMTSSDVSGNLSRIPGRASMRNLSPLRGISALAVVISLCPWFSFCLLGTNFSISIPFKIISILSGSTLNSSTISCLDGPLTQII